MLNFSLIGAAGYVAPRHMKAIKETGNGLVSVYDVHDGLAVLDSYFPHAACFSDFDDYQAFHRQHPVDVVSICSPNHYHFEHIAWALSTGANVICEKPLVLDPLQLDELVNIEKMCNRRVYTVLQLRLVQAVRELKRKIETEKGFYEVEVNYVSARGNWYFNSWKGHEKLSGGLVTNIGIHLFDLLLWLFGSAKELALVEYNTQRAKGSLELKNARVNWFLSINENDLPVPGRRSYREMTVNGTMLRLDEGMEALHTQLYRETLNGQGFGISEAKPSIELCSQIRDLAKTLKGPNL